MQISEEKDDSEESQRSRHSSRRNSTSIPRKNSIKKEEKKQYPLNTSSTHSTPKRAARQSIDFLVTGKQIVKRSDRANSLPGSYRRQSSESVISQTRPQRISETPRRDSSKSRETSLEDDFSLDLSQVSDFEDTNSKYGVSQLPLATSTPKPPVQKSKPRSASLQSHIQQRAELSSRRSQPRSQMSVELPRRSQQTPLKSRDSTFCSRDSLYKTSSSASTYRCGTEDSSVSPEYSQSSESPRAAVNATPSPLLSSCYSHSWAECTGDRTALHADGEWNSFWANYNNCLPKATGNSYYDQCPTPYRSENLDFDFDVSTEGSRIRSPEHIKHIGSIIRSEGLRLTPRETQNIIKCAHMLGNVLSHAIDRRARERDTTQINEPEDPEIEIKKKTLTLDLKETNIPEAKETKCEATTQTDISLPNTKSAPRIFENILRQLSKSSIDVPSEDPKPKDAK